MSLDPVFTADGAWRKAPDIARAVSTRQIAAIDVVDAALARIALHNTVLNAFTDITAERARATASALDRAVAAGQGVGPLAGVPFAVKNLYDIAGVTTRAGSRINRDNVPAMRDAALVERLEVAGAVLIGGLNK